MSTILLHGLLEPFADCLDAASAQRVVELGINPSIQQELSSLATKANQGLLTPEEQIDYEALVNAADVIAILKLKAQRRLDSTSRACQPAKPANWSAAVLVSVANTAGSGSNRAYSHTTSNISSRDSTAAPANPLIWR